MTIKREELRKYLLGELSEELADELDVRLFADDDLHRDLQDEQDSLIEDFAGGRLTGEEQASFRAQIARSPSLQEKVDSFRVLLAALERQTARISNPVPNRLFRLTILTSSALAILLCIAVFLYVREYRKNANLNSQLFSLSHTPQPIARSIAGNSVTVAFLSGNISRGPMASPEIRVPASASFLELQVEIHQRPPEEDTWDAEVLRGSEVIWKSSHIRLHRIGQEEFLALFIDAGDIPPDYYVVQYAPSSKSAPSRTRPFRVIEA